MADLELSPGIWKKTFNVDSKFAEKNNKRFYLLVVGCLELEELGCVVDEGEDDDGYYVTTSLADVPLHSNVCQRMDLNCKILWEEKVFQKTRFSDSTDSVCT